MARYYLSQVTPYNTVTQTHVQTSHQIWSHNRFILTAQFMWALTFILPGVILIFNAMPASAQEGLFN